MLKICINIKVKFIDNDIPNGKKNKIHMLKKT